MGQYPRLPIRINPPTFSHWLYNQRYAVERVFNKFRRLPAVATRYDKRDDNHLAYVKRASIRIWLRFIESVNQRFRPIPELRCVCSGDRLNCNTCICLPIKG